MKLFLTILFTILFGLVQGQNNEDIPDKWKKYLFDYKVNLINVDFRVNDTILPYTLVQEPDGTYYFTYGHGFTADSITLDYVMSYRFSDEPTDTAIRNLVFVKNDSTLKIDDLTNSFSLKHGGILNTYDYDFEFKPFIHEINYSYLLQKAGVKRIDKYGNDSLIRLTKYESIPYDDKNQRLKIYQTTKSFKELTKVSYSIDSINNLILNENKTIPLTKRESNILKEQFVRASSEKISFSTKTNQYNPFLVEYSSKDSHIVIERSDGPDSDERNNNQHDYHSSFQGFVALINNYGSLSNTKLEKRLRKMKK